MKYIYILVILLSTVTLVTAQNRFGNSNGVDEIVMEGHQYLQFDENNSKYFWAVDLNIFSQNQKSTFQELVFNSGTLIAVSTPDKNNYWYLASFKNTDQELVKVELNKLIDKAKTLNTNSQDKYQ